MPILREVKGPTAGHEYPVFRSRRPTVLGRDPENEIGLDDPRCSRRHAAIVLDRGRWVLQDLGSSNGTFVGRQRISRPVQLQDGGRFQAGSRLFAFAAGEWIPPPPDEHHGTRMLEALREDSGVFACRAHQSAMDREVRMDWIHPARRPEPSVVERIRAAANVGMELEHASLQPVLHVSADAGGPILVGVRGTVSPTDRAVLDVVESADLSVRLAFFRDLVEAVLERGAASGESHPIAFIHVEVDSALRPLLPAFDLGAFVAHASGDTKHLPEFAPYLPPEYVGEKGAAKSDTAAAVYNLGALGYHLLTRTPPMGEGDVVTLQKRHRETRPAPADVVAGGIPDDVSVLLDRMLAKEPASRPPGEEVARVLSRRADRGAESAAVAAPSPARSTIAWDDDESGVHQVAWDSPITDGPTAPEDEVAIEEVVPSRDEPPPVSRAAPTRAPRRPAPRAPTSTRPSGARFLPLWIAAWIGLFLAARFVSKWLSRELGL